MKISVIICCYNYGRYLARAIRSVIDQSLSSKHYEIIVVNDGSGDETDQIMETFSNYIIPIKLNENVGLAKARNIGIRKSLGQYVINLDADDYFDNNILKILSLFLGYNIDWDAVSCDYFTVDFKEKHIGRKNGEKYPIACGIMFRKELLVDIGLYDESFKAREEEDLRKRFLSKYKINNIELPLYRYHLHDENMTGNLDLMNKYKKKFDKNHGLEQQ